MKDTSMTTMKVREINRNKVYNYIYKSNTTCKLDITRNLNMGLSTVTQNLKALEDDGLICKNGFLTSTGGRKADALEIIPDAKNSIGIAILKDSFDIVCVNLYGKVSHSKTISCKFENNDSYFKLVSNNLDMFINENGINNILGVSFAIQGIVSSDGERISYGKILDNFELKLSDFSKYIKYPCRMEHDSKAACNLELWNNKEVKNAIVILLNLNLGGGLIANGEVLTGDNMKSGIIEHLPIEKNGELCYCGKKGCFETVCSGFSLKKSANMEISRFFDLLLQNDENSIQIWKNYLLSLAKALEILHIIIDGKIILSGYLACYLNQSDIDYILNIVNEHTSFPILKENIILSKNTSNTQALGTSLFYINEFLESV